MGPMDSPILSPTGPRHRKTRLSCRRIDRLCCSLLCYFPLVFISGVSTWAVYSYSYSICWNNIAGAKGIFLAFLGLALYFLLNWSYFTAVFTNPGSPLDNKHSYSSLPTTETSTNSSISVKSSGQARFCKKCQCYKPDRTHHCSSCKTCVLKMDHHCPWLANCLGLFNYKAFMLFLIYTSVFCLLCFVVSSAYVYEELLSSNSSSKYPVDDLTPVNWVLLAVLSGIIGLVLSGFTIWHLTLVGSGMTTIESLEKVRYTTPTLSRSGVPAPGAHHLYDNPENDPAFDYAAEREHEREQEFRRYNSYILEESTKKLPHPFDLGRARNFRCVFGPREEWWKWFIPRFSGVGDGWNWETSKEWRIAAEAVRVERERMGLDQGDDARSGWPGANRHPAAGRTWNGGNPNGLIRHAGEMKPSKAERILGKLPGTYSDGENVPLQRMNRAPDDISSDEEDDERIDLETGLAIGRKARMEPRSAGSVGWATWGGGTSEERW